MSRNSAQMKEAKRLLNKPAGKFEVIDLGMTNHPDWMTRAYKNNRYIVMIDDYAKTKGFDAIKMMVQTHDNTPIQNHWRELQNIKNEIFGEEETAVEFYPPESELVDEANVYWLWVRR